MNLTFHGAAKEVGRSCIELKTYKSRVFLDSGIKVTEHGIEYPIDVKQLNKVDAVFLSHAHLDHSGALAYFAKQGLKCPIYCTEMTKQIAKVLIKDSHKVELLENFQPKYGHQDIANAVRLMKVVQLNKQYQHKDILFTYYPAGHIAGAASVLLETNQKRILYSGDFNTIDIHSVKAPETYPKDVDYLILESTYGDREHPDRFDTELKFIDKIKEVLKRGGKVVIAGFAVGRIQELIMILADARLNVPIYVDGMGNKINQLLLTYSKNSNDIRDYKAFKKSLKRIIPVKGRNFRNEIVKEKKAIYVSTSGMLTGGPVITYLKEIWDDSRNAILLTGYQVESTNGRLLLDTGKLFLDGIQVNVKAEYHKFDFSAHAGLKEMDTYVKRMNPKKIILNHGDEEIIDYFSKYLTKKGYNVIVPELNKTIDLS